MDTHGFRGRPCQKHQLCESIGTVFFLCAAGAQDWLICSDFCPVYLWTLTSAQAHQTHEISLFSLCSYTITLGYWGHCTWLSHGLSVITLSALQSSTIVRLYIFNWNLRNSFLEPFTHVQVFSSILGPQLLQISSNTPHPLTVVQSTSLTIICMRHLRASSLFGWHTIYYIYYSKTALQMVSSEKEKHASSVTVVLWQMLSDHSIMCRQWLNA